MNVMRTIEEEVEYCFYVMNNAKTRGNNSCQVPIFAKPETIQILKDKGFNCHQEGFDASEPYAHLSIKF
jgi:hypothetical protein